MTSRPLWPAEQVKVERAEADVRRAMLRRVIFDVPYLRSGSNGWGMSAELTESGRDWLFDLLIVMAIAGTGVAGFLLGLAARS